MEISDDIAEDFLIQGLIYDLLQATPHYPPQIPIQNQPKQKKIRKFYGVGSFKSSTWYKTLNDTQLLNENSKAQKLFKNRFRVSITRFYSIVDDCKKWYLVPEKDICGRDNPPLTLKVQLNIYHTFLKYVIYIY